MTRTRGAKNRDHDAKREALAARVLAGMMEKGGAPSLNEMARDADASIPTLKHYFGDRSGVTAAALRTVKGDAAPFLEALEDPGALALGPSLARVATELAEAWGAHGVGRTFSVGLAAGMFDAQAGPGYLDGVLEPTILALEARLRAHAARGHTDFAPGDALSVRTAALAFLSPVLVALLHQDALSGARCRPLDVPRFLTLHVERFVAAYGARAAGPAPRRAPRRKSTT